MPSGPSDRPAASVVDVPWWSDGTSNLFVVPPRRNRYVRIMAGERMTSERRADRFESFGEALLGAVLDRAHELPPHLIGPLVADVVEKLGGCRPQVLLQDCGQLLLVPLPGEGLPDGEPHMIDGSEAGRCFLDAVPVELPEEDGVRVHMPLLDGGDQVGVMAVTLDSVDDDDRRLLHRISGLVADLLVTKHGYSDLFFRVRRAEAMSAAAGIPWSLLPPLAMIMPWVAVAGILEPAYDVAGDSFDYALNGDVLHVVMIDAMGHGLDAATKATVAIGAYRHARRLGIGLSEIYDFMDRAVAEQFGPEYFVTAQMLQLDTTMRVQWVNAGHPPRSSSATTASRSAWSPRRPSRSAWAVHSRGSANWCWSAGTASSASPMEWSRSTSPAGRSSGRTG